MNAAANHPVLYQVHHPWHWLTYGQNAAAVGVICATGISAVSIYVLARTLFAVNRQAEAAEAQAKAANAQAEAARKQAELSEQLRVTAERSALAAEEQVAAAKSSAEASDAQRIATEASAVAEQAHSELIRHQLLASLRPVLLLTRRGNAMHEWEYFVENHGGGMAVETTMRYRKLPPDGITLSHNVVGPGMSVMATLDARLLSEHAAQINYRSEDGRYFVSVVALSNQELNHQIFQTTELGGWIAPAAIPELKSPESRAEA